MFGQSLLSGAFGSEAIVPNEHLETVAYTGTAAGRSIGGQHKGALMFDGGSVNVPDINSVIGNDFTISFWVRTPSTAPSSGYPAFMAAYGYLGYGSAYGWSCEFPNANKVMFYWVSSSAVGNYHMSSTLSLDTWYHVLVTKDSTSCNIYINNTLDNATTSVNSYAMWYSTQTDLTIGSKRYTHDGAIAGALPAMQLDTVRIFNDVVSADERAALYAEDNTTDNTLDFPSGAGCIAAYNFNGHEATMLSQANLSTCDFPSGAGCQSLYQFNNNVTDTCGNNTMTATDIAYNNRSPFGTAAVFNGSTSKLSLGDNDTLFGSSFTYSVWIYNTANNSSADHDFQTIIAKRVSGDADAPITMAFYGYNFVTSGNRGKFYVNLQGTYFVSSVALKQDMWMHLAYTFNASDGAMKLYINGVQDGSATFSGTQTPNNANINIGSGYTSGTHDYEFFGYMDQIRIFNTALSSSQVGELARGTPKYNGESIDTMRYEDYANFKPDLVWIKDRTTNYSSVVIDSVRGATWEINTNDATADYQDTEGVEDFRPHGFTLGTRQYSYGKDNDNYVAWMWKAGDDNYSTYFNGTEGSGGSKAFDVPTGLATVLRNASAFSISIWVNPDQIAKPGAYDPEIVRFLDNIYLRLIHQNDGKVHLLLSDSSNTNRTATSTSALTPGKWTHICATGSSSGLVLYIDGSQDATGTWDGSFVTYSSPYYQTNTIGSAENAGSSPPANPHSVFKGYLDQYRLYNTQLTSSQVTELYQESSGTNSTLNFPTGAGCVALYELNGDCNDTGGSYSAAAQGNLKKSKGGYHSRNGDGSIKCATSVNKDAGFSIVKYIGNGTQNATVGTGLGKQPNLVMIKHLLANDAWFVGSTSLSTNNFMELNTSAVATTNSNLNYTLNANGTIQFTGSSPHDMINKNLGSYIAYCWTDIDKYSKTGTYTWSGTNYTAGTMVTGLGFRPRRVMIKGIDVDSDWHLYDDKRGAWVLSGTSKGKWQAYALYADDSGVEQTTGWQSIFYDDDGFSAGVGNDGNTTGSGGLNKNGHTYLYIAWA
tara:strand:- start:1816 stop:4950 length:3135 start_codon:yes stop_codon:yes gene_type:complete